jgi:hypothetical protein
MGSSCWAGFLALVGDDGNHRAVQALGIRLPDLAQQLLIVGGAGMMPVLAVAILYPAGQPAARLTAG